MAEAAQQSDRARLIRQHWRVILAAWLGWLLDAFDLMIVSMLLVHLSKHFSVSLTAMGLVLSASTWGRIAGNAGTGWIADHWGRRLTFLAAVWWFALMSGVSGLAWSYTSFLIIRTLFGLGFGAEWTSSASLLMESVPPQIRSLASAIMMSGFEFGYLFAAGVAAVIYPWLGWRAVFFFGIIPAVFAIWIRRTIPESPVWLKAHGRAPQQQMPSGALPTAQTPAREGEARVKLTWPALQGWLFMFMLQFQNAAIFAFLPPFLQKVHHLNEQQVFPYVATYAVTSIVGKPVCGWLGTHLGHRPTLLIYLALTIPGAILFTHAGTPWTLAAGIAVMGILTNSIFALVPAFLARRFSSSERGKGMGIGYAVGFGAASVASYVVPALGSGWGLASSMEAVIIAGSLGAAVFAALRPNRLPGQVMETDEPSPQLAKAAG